MKINFLLTGEGVSDLRLTEHIEDLLILEGFSEVSGEAPDLTMFSPTPGRTVHQKISALLRHYPNTDLIFVHRDSDGEPINDRELEIYRAAQLLNIENTVIPLIPVRSLEAWLLADENLIKEVAGNRTYRSPIKCLPKIKSIENLADPKNTLVNVLCEVSEAQGAKLRQFKSRFGEMRARLTFGLSCDGPVKNLPSYVEFRRKVNIASQRLLADS